MTLLSPSPVAAVSGYLVGRAAPFASWGGLSGLLFGTARRFWCVVFLYALVVASLLQLVVLPYLLTGLHAGNGLLAGGDWVGFHEHAARLADRIAERGWGAWELRFERQAPAGIAAAFYVLFGPHPWVLIPLSAAVHATSAVLIFLMLRPFVSNAPRAALCALPFVLFPSAMTLYGQIHKDGAYCLGMLLCLYSIVLLSRMTAWTGRCSGAGRPLACFFAGNLLIWVMRPYGLTLIQGMGIILSLWLAPCFALRAWRKQMPVSRALLAAVALALLPAVLGGIKGRATGAEVALVNQEILSDFRPSDTPADMTEEQRRGSFAIKVEQASVALNWKRTTWLPHFLDNAFLTLSVVRFGFAGSPGGSNIDTSVMFHRASDFFAYLSRAVQIGVAAPFPDGWFFGSTGKASSIMKAITAAEMIVVYLALLFLPYAVWQWRKAVEIWIILIFCSVFILLYTYITPNVGSLYRFRFGYLMVLAAVGIAGAQKAWQMYNGRHTSVPVAVSAQGA